jgi:prepilin-type N-terminal cleavage/methylation domain-containing protein
MSGLMRRETHHRRRRGMTLIEIMISLVLLGIVGGTIMRVIMRQQRFYQGVNQIMTQRGELRNATSVLPVELRSLSSIGADILVASDSSIEFMQNVGTAIVCEVVDGAQVALPPENLNSGQVLTSFYGYGDPQAGYSVYIYNDSSVVGNEDDRWQKFTLSDLHSDAARCPGGPPGSGAFTRVADLGKRRAVLELSSTEPNDPVTFGPLSQYIGVGAPVRIMRRVKYKLYQASDSKWYLGFAPYNYGSSAYDELSPVSGPYDAYSTSSGTPSGFGFRYFTVDDAEVSAGADSATRSTIARVDLIARARTSSKVRTAGVQGGASQQYKDSLAVAVMLRNRQ